METLWNIFIGFNIWSDGVIVLCWWKYLYFQETIKNLIDTEDELIFNIWINLYGILG